MGLVRGQKYKQKISRRNIVNLEMLPWRNNLSKNKKCSITKNELFERFDNKIII